MGMAEGGGLHREVEVELLLALPEATSGALAVELAGGLPTVGETLTLESSGGEVVSAEHADAHGTRLRLFDAPAGDLRIAYRAAIEGRAPAATADAGDRFVGIRPSRYAPSDALGELARSEFGGLRGVELVHAVGDWVHSRLEYDPGATTPTGGALETLDAGRGVCRDYAHLVAALLRALDVPARVVAVYAPGLRPPDFHAVVEALVDDRWLVVDATRLAPRATMARIATGRDAADTAWITTTGADIEVRGMSVRASADPLPSEDPTAPVALG